MKTRLTTLLWVCAAIVGAALLSGCSKSSFSHFGGKQIRFATVSGGSVSTKTAYGDDKGGKQALNWVSGDVITIASPQAEVQNVGGHASNYVVTLKENGEGVPSYGTVANEGSNGLAWLDTDPEKGYDFFGIYPKTSNAISVVPSTGVVTATLPESQTNEASTETKSAGEGEDAITYTIYKPDMSLAFMSAAASGVKSSDKTVSLEFFPAFTAFEFNVSSQGEEIEVLSIQLVADAEDAEETEDKEGLSGTYTFDAGELTSENKASLTTLNKTATLNLATTTEATESTEATTTGVKVTKTEGASFTLFTAPVANTKALTLKVKSKDGENATKTDTVILKYGEKATEHTPGDAVVFEAGHKYRINMLKLRSSKWRIIIKPEFKDWIVIEEGTMLYI